MRSRMHGLIMVALVVGFCGFSLAGQDAAPVPDMKTPLLDRNALDPTAFTEWVNGKESPVMSGGRESHPANVVWTQNSKPAWNGIPAFGTGRALGPRHLRIGFKAPITVGALLTSGNCSVSYLKPDATYPGSIADASQWLPAERISQEKDLRRKGAEFVLWAFPANTQTQAIRFTHTPKETDHSYAGKLGGVYLFGQRFCNFAPHAVINASVNQKKIGMIADEQSNGWGYWDNWNDKNPPKPVGETSPWVMLAWKRRIPISGLGALSGGFGAVEVYGYRGPKNRHPAEAQESDWKLIKKFDGLSSLYPLSLPIQWMDFGKTIKTNALKIKMTDVAPENHPHIKNSTRKGCRVWLDELLVLCPIGSKPLSDFRLKQKKDVVAHPPIPIPFKLKEPGYVTLVIDDAHGKRIRNLVSETPFPAGDNIAWWDGMDDVGRDAEAARHGLYHVPGVFVSPGTYKVRGLSYKAIDLFYEFPVYTAGNPAWNTADKTGAWLSNHSAPSCTLFVPASRNPYEKDLVYIGSHVSEGTHGLAWVDLDGRKVGGVNWIGGIWTGAQFLALDEGTKADLKTILYVGSNFDGELRLTALTRSGQTKVFKMGTKADGKKYDLGGFAARDGILVCSLPKCNKLLYIDVASGKQIGEMNVATPRGIACDSKGNLLVISGQTVLRFANGSVPPKGKAQAQAVVTKGLDEPVRITVDSADTMFISDRGGSHQIKIFTAKGEQMRSLGKRGKPQAGPYNPLHMNNPAGLTVDNKGRVWVAENDEQPKRVSVWKYDGSLVKAFYGPAEYGGGGRLDPQDKTLFYYKGMQFKLDWEKGKDKLTSIYWRPGVESDGLPKGFGIGGFPQAPIYTNGRKYFTNCYNSNPTNGANMVTVWIEEKGIAKLVAMIGMANSWNLLKSDEYLSRWPKDLDPKGDRWKNQAFFIWGDLNDDRRPQPGEMKIVKGKSGGVVIMSDLSAVVSRLDGNAMRFPVAKFTPGGAPIYDINGGEVLCRDVQSPESSGGDQALVAKNGWTVFTNVPKPYSKLSVAGVYKGEPRWSYPDPWPGLHPAHEAPVPDRPGMLIGTTRLLGDLVTPRNSDAGPLWCVNGNMGPMFLMSVDGLFVATLFKDVRQGASWSMPIGQRGMKLNDVSPHDENFWPSITQTKDGKVYLVDGARTSLVRVEGLETIKRFPDSEIKITESDLKKAQNYFAIQEVARQAAQGRKTLHVTLPKAAPVVDGKLDDWQACEWAEIDKRGTAANFNSNSKPYDVQAAVQIAQGRLFVAYRTGDKNLLRNSGEDAKALFKNGGALDLMLAANPAANSNRTDPVAGDLRLLVTKVKGKTAALLYRAVVTGTKKEERVPFSSPWRTIYFDKVEDVSSQVQLAGDNGDYEVSVPLSVIRLKARKGKEVKADLGILRGDGFQTLQRVYWSNKATAITSDVPSEAMLSPNLWGEWKLQ